MKIRFIFDVESIGLHGEGFAVAGVVCCKDGVEMHRFAYHCPPDNAEGEQSDRDWVKANVTIHESSIETLNPFRVRELFWKEWLRWSSDDCQMFVECGWPVEARFIAACIDNDKENRKWKGPYPVHEISTVMACAKMDPMATYDRAPDELPAHEPLADSRLSSRLLSIALNRLDDQADLAWRYQELD